MSCPASFRSLSRFDRLAEPGQLGLLRFLPLGGGAGEQQAVDDLFHRDVAGQVPQRLIHQGVDVHMPEHAVEHQMQIVPDGLLLFLLVPEQDVPGVVVQVLPVGGEGQGCGGEDELAQGGVQEAQVDQKGVPGQQKYLTG